MAIQIIGKKTLAKIVKVCYYEQAKFLKDNYVGFYESGLSHFFELIILWI